MADFKKNELTIIIPVYNEGESVIHTYKQINEDLKDFSIPWKILFVNDGSKDNSEEILRTNNYNYISHEVNKGYGAAIKTGARHCDTEYFAIIDCDCTYPPSEIPKLMKYAEEYPMVVGARDVRKNPWLHRLSKNFMCWTLSFLFNKKVEDINSGLRIFNTKVFLEYIPSIGDKFSLTSSVTYAFLLDEIPFTYVPIEYNKRVGESKVRRVSFTKSFIECFRRVRDFHISSSKEDTETGKKIESAAFKKEIKPSPFGRADWIIIAVIFIYAVLFGALLIKKQFISPFNVRDDAFQHLYWMAKYHDPALFSGDMYARYAQSLSIPGYEGLLYVLTYFMLPMEAGKYLSIILFGITGIFCYLLGKSYWNRLSGILLAALFVMTDSFFDRFEGGLHRAFMFPLMFMFMYVLTAQKKPAYGWALAVQAFFYPVSLVMSAVTMLINFFIDKESRKGIFKGNFAKAGWIFLLLVLIVSGQIRKSHKPDFLGEMVTKSEMLKDPVFREGGRSPYFPIDPLPKMIEERLLRSSMFRIALLFVSVLFFLYMWLKTADTRRIWAPLLSLFITSVLLFELAKIFLFKLYIPDRYVEYSFPMLSVMLSGLGGSAIIMMFVNCSQRKLALILLLAALFIPSDLRKFPRFLEPYTFEKNDKIEVYEYLAKTDKNCMIAADPYISDKISGFSLRKTLLKYELFHPWYKDYRKITEERTVDFYRGFYANNEDQLFAFIEKYGINYIVCRKSVFFTDSDKEESQKNFFTYEPLNKEILDQYKEWEKIPFVIPQLDKKYRCFENKQYFILDCGKITADCPKISADFK